jgi:sulfatase maturation enzyme AslB (radical SAM superfamily)
MPNKDIFCNAPWTNLHIYYDGSYGMCCAERHKAYELKDASLYNIKKLNPTEWYNSKPMQDIRIAIHQENKLSACDGCYIEESYGAESKRVKENYKSVIFTEQAFDRSYNQNPLVGIFEDSKKDGVTSVSPIDWHVDLGNECNLACKMCDPEASSKIALAYRRWNMLADNKIFANWTNDDDAWANFLEAVKQTPNLNRLHFMGGEPLLNKRLEPLLDYFITLGMNRTLSLSFVTNGTIYRQSLVDKLLQFAECDIEVSLESFDKTNDYIRQGSKVSDTVANIEKLKAQANKNFRLIMRSVPQLLNANSYHNYIEWCWQNRIPIVSLPLKRPLYLRTSILPKSIRNKLLENYLPLHDKLQQAVKKQFNSLASNRDVSRIESTLFRECSSMIIQLQQQEPADVEIQRKELIIWLKRWDILYNLNALDYYPEYKEFFLEYGY